jgi:uncharacterized membrane protein YphA (DoxX/SURF4 family)
MLNIFPDLLSFALLAPFILRLTVGITFMYISFFVIYNNRINFFEYYKKHHYPLPIVLTWFFGILNLIVGLFLVVGFLTQVVVLIAIYLLVSLYLCDQEIKTFEFQKSFYILLGIVCLSLLFLGAGAFAVDIPL